MNRRGFVLLSVLAVLALAGLILAGIARQSLSQALDVTESVESLQRRWGDVSCQRAMLSRAKGLFARREAEAERAGARMPEAVVRTTLVLSGVTYELTLADEDAKASLNAIHRDAGAAQAARAVQRAAADSGLTVRLRPRQGGEDGAPLFSSWGQVFATSEADVADRPAALAEATDELTCWGRGQLNIFRAADDSIDAVFGAALRKSQRERMLELRRVRPRLALESILDELELREEVRQRVQDLATDESRCFSLWMTTSRGALRSYRLEILEAGEQQRLARQQTFAW